MRRAILPIAMGCAGLLLAACGVQPTPGLARGESLFTTCAPCHGEAGEGKQEVEAPAIAGLDQWYIEAQIEKFATGVRGGHPDDLAGLRMRPMARSLELDGDVPSVAEYVSKMPKPAIEPTLGGNAEKGAAGYAVCVACHGPEGAGNKALGAPPLTGQADWYLASQIHKFKDGVRGAHPKDATGATMRPMAMIIADDKAAADIFAYIRTLAAKP